MSCLQLLRLSMGSIRSFEVVRAGRGGDITTEVLYAFVWRLSGIQRSWRSCFLGNRAI